MAYSIGGKIYTDHALMDEVVHSTKIILNSIVLKNSKLADLNETEESVAESDILLAIDNGSARLSFIPLSVEVLVNFGYTYAQANFILEIDHPEEGKYDRSRVPEEDRDALLEFACKYFVEHYEEKNNYYRMLNGQPEYGSEKEYFVYVNPDDYTIPDLEDLIDIKTPIHLMSNADYNTIESLGIMEDILSKYTEKEYRYLKYLGTSKVDILFARKAKQWDILYIPNVQSLVLDRFKELFQINRDIYLRTTYQLAYSYNSDYFDEMIMFMITCQTFADMITDIPEWYIRRDVFDLRSCQYFLESQGVQFFKEIPLKYQIRIVKSLNKLIKYKSTTKNIKDILEIFGMKDTTVYKYFIFKQLLTEKKNPYDGVDVIIPDTHWIMPVGEYAFEYGDEGSPTTEPIGNVAEEAITCLDHAVSDDYNKNPDGTVTMQIYDFIDEDASDASENPEASDDKEENDESRKIYEDEYGNQYDLGFVKTPIEECYDKYINNNLNIEDYDSVTPLDKYWDGEDVHSLVKNEHLAKDFTIEGTKYMFIDTTISMTEYTYQMSYFMNMILSSHYDFEDVQIPVSTVKYNSKYSLTDICVLLYTLSLSFMNKSTSIVYPIGSEGHEEKGNFEAYWMVDGTYAHINPSEEIFEVDGRQMEVVFNPELIYPTYMNIHFYDDDDYIYQEKFRMNVDGRFGIYSDITQEYFCDWTKYYHEEWYMDDSGIRIYGFNPNVDLDAIAESIGSRHSSFSFEHGYTLEDFGLENFSTKSKFESVDELLETYRANTKAYDNLTNKIIYENDSYDKYLVMKYLFDNLFVIPYDTEFYRLKNGDLATDFVQILKEKDYSLYKFYIDLMSESDEETRKDNIRLVLNEIVDILEFYIKSEDTRFVFSFVPTNSLDAINHYINLMIGFFKSWKVYFLDPHSTYVLDSRLENKVNMSDNITEFKDSYWYYDKNIIQDAMNFIDKYYADEKHAAGKKEIIDIYGYSQWFATDEFDIDGGYYDQTANPVEDAFNNEGIVNVDRDINGADPEFAGPYWTVNGGHIGARLDLTDIDGGGALDAREYVDIDGENVATGLGNFYPKLNDNTVPTYDVDGGWVDGVSGKTKSMKATIDGHKITMDVVNSRDNFNDIQILDDGLYLEDTGVTEDEFEDLREQMLEDRSLYEGQLEEDLDIIKMYNNPDYLRVIVDEQYAGLFSVTKQVLDDFRSNATLHVCNDYTNNAVATLRNWFIELDLFGWEYF